MKSKTPSSILELPRGEAKTAGFYEYLRYDFYDEQKRSKNPVRSWFHLTRYKTLNSLVGKYYAPGKKIIDLGAGSCEWNTDHLPVTGVDLNQDMLEYGRRRGTMTDYKVSDFEPVDFEDCSVDILIISEVLEHIRGYGRVVDEMRRVLKPGGVAIISVPYDTVFSLWKPLFFAQCLLQGYVFGSQYYRSRCGHIHSFSPEKIADVLRLKGFDIVEQFDIRRFTIFTVARKGARCS